MKKQFLYLDFIFPSLNMYISSLKKHRLQGQAMKTLYTDQVEIECRHQKISPYDKPIELAFFYYEKRANRDPDNIVAFSKKAILDGLVNAKIIPNDNQKYIKRFTDEWTVDNKNTGVLVIIKEWKDDKRASPLGPVRSN